MDAPDIPFTGLEAIKWMRAEYPSACYLDCGRNGNYICKFIYFQIQFSTSRSKNLPYDRHDHARLYFVDKRKAKESPNVGREITSWEKLRKILPVAGDFDWRPNEVIPEDYYAG